MPAYLPNSGGPNSSKPPPQWLVRVIGLLLAVGVLIVAVFLGGVILVTGAVLGVGLWGWMWWQKRKMVKRMGAQGGAGAQQWGPMGGAQGFRRPGAGAGQSAGPSAGRGGANGQDENIIEGDFEVLDDDDPRGGRRR